MAKRRKRKPKTIPMKIGNDPSLWRYASLQEALEANTDNLARLIRAGQEAEARRQQEAEEANESSKDV